MITPEQRAVCEKYGVPPADAPEELTAGVAVNVAGTLGPVNGLRHPPEGSTTGWYLWAGEELSSDPEFFQPVHVKHLPEIRPEVLEYLALPPGWRFLIADDYEDVWYDASLLNVGDETAATGAEKRDAFSEAIFPGWMRVSLIGLAVSAAAWVLGALGREALQGNTTPLGIVARMVTAAVEGFGTGFTIFFLLLSAAGVLFWLQDRR